MISLAASFATFRATPGARLSLDDLFCRRISVYFFSRLLFPPDAPARLLLRAVFSNPEHGINRLLPVRFFEIGEEASVIAYFYDASVPSPPHRGRINSSFLCVPRRIPYSDPFFISLPAPLVLVLLVWGSSLEWE